MIMTKIIYYIHYNKEWYYWIDSIKDNNKVHLNPSDILDNDKYIHITDINIISEKDCRIYLANKYPTLSLKKAYFYHEGPKRLKHPVERKHDMKDKYKNKQMIYDIKNYKNNL